MKFSTAFFAALLLNTTLITSNTLAADYQVDTKNSAVVFQGTHSEIPFEGQFKTWQAEISFDADKLNDSHIKATLQTDSAETGNKMYDGTLPQEDWFNAIKFPEITFVSKTITADKDKGYVATGDLTIRGITHPAKLNFTLSDTTQPEVTAKGELSIDRLDYDIGKKSDKEGEWVGKTITVQIHLKAKRKA